jgi:ribosomal protein L22
MSDKPTEEQVPDESEEQAKPAAKAKPDPAEKAAAKKPTAKAAADAPDADAEAEKPSAKKTPAKKAAAKKPAAKESSAKKPAGKKPAEEAESAATTEKSVATKVEKPASAKAKKPAAAAASQSEASTAHRKVVRAQARYVRTSARKARMVCGHLRGKSVPEARAILAFTPREVARDWSKLLESAVANAENNHELIEDDLLVREAYADEGPTIKRFRPRAQGRASPIRKRTSHLTITLTPKP